MDWKKVGEDEWQLFTPEGAWVGYVDPKYSFRKAAVWDDGWWSVPLPPAWSIEDAKAAVLATAALEA